MASRIGLGEYNLDIYYETCILFFFLHHSRRGTARSVAIGREIIWAKLFRSAKFSILLRFGPSKVSSSMPILNPASKVDVVIERSGLKGSGNRTEGRAAESKKRWTERIRKSASREGTSETRGKIHHINLGASLAGALVSPYHLTSVR